MLNSTQSFETNGFRVEKIKDMNSIAAEKEKRKKPKREKKREEWLRGRKRNFSVILLIHI